MLISFNIWQESPALVQTAVLFLERRSLKKLTVFLLPPARTCPHTHVCLWIHSSVSPGCAQPSHLYDFQARFFLAFSERRLCLCAETLWRCWAFSGTLILQLWTVPAVHMWSPLASPQQEDELPRWGFKIEDLAWKAVHLSTSETCSSRSSLCFITQTQVRFDLLFQDYNLCFCATNPRQLTGCCVYSYDEVSRQCQPGTAVQERLKLRFRLFWEAFSYLSTVPLHMEAQPWPISEELHPLHQAGTWVEPHLSLSLS